jgi:hypothetical protein
MVVGGRRNTRRKRDVRMSQERLTSIFAIEKCLLVMDSKPQRCSNVAPAVHNTSQGGSREADWQIGAREVEFKAGQSQILVTVPGPHLSDVSALPSLTPHRGKYKYVRSYPALFTSLSQSVVISFELLYLCSFLLGQESQSDEINSFAVPEGRRQCLCKCLALMARPSSPVARTCESKELLAEDPMHSLSLML